MQNLALRRGGLGTAILKKELSDQAMERGPKRMTGVELERSLETPGLFVT